MSMNVFVQVHFQKCQDINVIIVSSRLNLIKLLGAYFGTVAPVSQWENLDSDSQGVSLILIVLRCKILGQKL